jgi:Flp pilus assembly protein TadG
MLRRAVAAVETAITMPLLVLMVFGSIEVANSIFLAQTLSFASYEGAREAARPGATVSQVNDRVAQIMHARGIFDYSLTITPQLTQTTERGTMMTVRVEAAMSALSTYATGLTSEHMTAQEVSMVKH